MTGKIYVGVGGWTFEPWRGPFYPNGLPHKRELEFASRKLTSIEINGTYYSTFKPESWTKWHDETPDGFVFSIKASRYCTNRKQLATAGGCGGPLRRPGPGQSCATGSARSTGSSWRRSSSMPTIWHSFLKLLPREVDGLPLRHALEVRHPSFKDPRFYDLARRHNVAIVFADSDEFPAIDEPTADFTYARLMRTEETDRDRAMRLRP